MIVVATDAPLDAQEPAAARRARDLRAGADRLHLLQRQRRLRHRLLDAPVAPRHRRRRAADRGRVLPTDGVSGLFEAVLDATEEAIDNSLLKATDVTGNGRTIRAIPDRRRCSRC